MKNAYEIRGDTTAIFLNSPTYGAMETLIATADLEKAQEYAGNWRALWHKGTRSYYVRGSIGKTRVVSLHRWIMGVVDDPAVLVDHVLHDTLDNCRWALRPVTHQENMDNKRLYCNNYSGCSGVTWYKAGGKWMATIQRDGKSIYLGYFLRLEDAVAARKCAESENKTINSRSVAN